MKQESFFCDNVKNISESVELPINGEGKWVLLFDYQFYFLNTCFGSFDNNKRI